MKRFAVTGMATLVALPFFASAVYPEYARAATCLDLARTLTLNSRGTDVSRLQEFLRDNVGYTGAITGNFGPLTQGAVQKWQRERSIVSSGTPSTTGYGSVGPRTRAAMACTKAPIIAQAPPPGSSVPNTSTTIESLKAEIARLTNLLALLSKVTPNLTPTPAPTPTPPPVPIPPPVLTPSPAPPPAEPPPLPPPPPPPPPAPVPPPLPPPPVPTPSPQPQTYPAIPNPPQTRSVDGYNLYSPFPIIFNGQPRLYFGGWLAVGETHDNIYVADCPFGSGSCTNIRKVIDAVSNGLEHVNDPTIVLHAGIPPTNRPYYIMYMTSGILGHNLSNLSENAIYYSTSWADDGITWSKPTLLMSGFWLASATMRNGHVELYANSTTDGRVAKFGLGESGIAVGSPMYATFDNPPSIPAFYANVDVVWRPTLNVYQMVAERELQATPDSSSVIDYLTSSDGARWHLQYPSIISPVAGQYRVGTPSQWPDSAQWVYFGTTAQNDSMGFKINFTEWNAPANTNLANALTALEAALKGILQNLGR